MATVEFEGHTFNVDKDGFLDDFNNWNEAWVRHVQAKVPVKWPAFPNRPDVSDSLFP
jgi:sulfur relay (sulfurtransferase) DsrC/TusE family protein